MGKMKELLMDELDRLEEIRLAEQKEALSHEANDGEVEME